MRPLVTLMLKPASSTEGVMHLFRLRNDPKDNTGFTGIDGLGYSGTNVFVSTSCDLSICAYAKTLIVIIIYANLFHKPAAGYLSRKDRCSMVVLQGLESMNILE